MGLLPLLTVDDKQDAGFKRARIGMFQLFNMWIATFDPQAESAGEDVPLVDSVQLLQQPEL
jgi:hypothetical protein